MSSEYLFIIGLLPSARCRREPIIIINTRPFPEEGHKSLPVAYHERTKGYPNRKHLIQSPIKSNCFPVDAQREYPPASIRL